MADSNEEISALRSQVTRLTSELSDVRRGANQPASGTGGREGRWRSPTVALLLVLVFLLSPLSVLASWAHDEISDTDRYVATVDSVASQPAVQDAIANRVTDAIFAKLDVTAVTDRAVSALARRGLSPRATASLKALTVPMVSGVREFLHAQVLALVRSDAFRAVWLEANRDAHPQLVAVLTGRTGPATSVSNGDVSINLEPIIDLVKARLAEQGFTLASRLPSLNTSFTVFESDDLMKARTGFRLLSAVAYTLPLVVLLLFGLAVWVARRRRRTIVVGALAVAVSMLWLGIMLNVFRDVYLSAIPPSHVPADAAAVIYDALGHMIRLELRVVLIVCLVVAAIAWLGGAEPAPTAVRQVSSRAVSAVRQGSDRSGLHTGSFGVSLWTYRAPLRGVVLGVAFVVYVLASHPGPRFVLLLLVLALLCLFVLEVLARPGGPSPEETSASVAVPSEAGPTSPDGAQD